MASLPSLDQFRGCLLGQAVADAVGAPYEGLSSDNIFYGFGSGVELIDTSLEETVYYTDDTQMMIGVAETLVDCCRVDEERLCQAFVENYHPERAYGQGARRVLESMATGGDWRTLAETQFPGGSFGNGAAMRAAPIGLFFADDTDTLWDEAKAASLPTHIHPVGIEGAQLIALAVAFAARERPLARKKFLGRLARCVKTEEFQWHFSIAKQLEPGDSLSGLGSSLPAHRSVVTAITCFAHRPTSFEEAVSYAIGLGDDTDTLAAMVGALVGAHLGIEAVPKRMLARLENVGKGRDYIAELAERLWRRATAKHSQ